MSLCPLSRNLLRQRSTLFREERVLGMLTFRQMSFLRNLVMDRSGMMKTSSSKNSSGIKNEKNESQAVSWVDNKRNLWLSSFLARETDDDRPVFQNPFSRDFGKYEKVMPADVTEEVREIPDGIDKPDYWQSGYPPLKFGRLSAEVEIKSPEAISKMRKACALARKVLSAAAKEVKPGMTTQQLDNFVFDFTIAHGAYPSPLNYKGFPKSVCTSVNNVACHGIPDDRPLADGDIINVDVMVYIDGYHGDCSETVLVGNVDEMGRKLVEVAKTCLDRGILVCGPGVPFKRIGQTIEEVAEEQGFTVVPAFTGHGIGNQIHGPPDIYHYEALVQKKTIDNVDIDFPYPGKMMPGMTFTIEPVLSQGMEDVIILGDGWTAVTLDGSRTAQFEHTVLITAEGAEILTCET